MASKYSKDLLLFARSLCFILLITSCRKDKKVQVSTTAMPLASIGMYEVDSSIYKRIFIPITKVGTQNVTYFGVFDTGSPGMTLDANGLLPASMITSSGITVAGDSVNVNGITVTAQQAVVSYGTIGNETQEYGNLAYAPITIGGNGATITTTRIPFFLYYKIVDVRTGKTELPHSNDVFGVAPGFSDANHAIGSPLSYFKMPANVTSGFKLALLPQASFSINGTFVQGLLTIGLVPSDLSSTSGFIMHSLAYFPQGGYSPDIPSTITYNGKSVPGTILFDTGTPAVSTLADNTGPSTVTTLPANSVVTITTTSGFTYQYTTSSSYNLTQVGRPSVTGDPRTIFSIDFFISNEFLMNYADHKIGLKNN